MFLEKIQLTNFRNLPNLDINFSDSMNILVGSNAQGKTNLMEAINLLVSTKSFRATRESEMIRWGEETARVYGKSGHTELEILINRTTKDFRLNNLTSKAIEVVGVIGGVIFTPTDIEMLKDSPTQRRRFLDILISKINRKYLYDLSAYSQVVKNRNKVLYWLKVGRSSGITRVKDSDLSIWNDQLVELGANIINTRFFYIERLNKHLQPLGERLLGYPITIAYQTKLTPSKGLEFLKQEFRANLKEKFQEEVEKISSLIGPHRDDFKLLNHSFDIKKEVDLAVFGSRGEQRSGVLALKLSELKISEEEKEDKVILILDDVLSELDQDHQELLLEMVEGNQTFITTTHLDFFPKDVLKKSQVYKTEKGEITKTS